MSPAQIKNELLSSRIYIHPSLIDNSPNSLCEAMLLGVPCIGSYSGGIPSLLENNYDGFLFNSTDPFDLAGKIYQLLINDDLANKFSKNARRKATLRHDPSFVTLQILNCYEDILGSRNNNC
jgi:glycosyltransferase involved in cell wall biosynthesis